MPAEQPAPPASSHPFSNPTPSPFNAGLSTPAQSVSESPVVNSPGGKSSTPSLQTPGSGGKGKGILGLILVIVLLIGAGIGGLYYVRNSQISTTEEEPSPTPEPQSTARIVLEPGSGTLTSGQEQQLQFSLDLSNTPVNISAVEFTVNFGGTLPGDMSFVPDSRSPLPPPTPEFTTLDSGKSLKVTYPFEQIVNAPSKKITLGILQFTAPGSGQLNIRFDSANSKVITAPNSIDILRPPSIISYTFQPQAIPESEASASAETASASAASQLAQANLTATPVPTTAAASSSAKASASPLPTATATTRPAGSTSGVGGTAATATPTRTPSPTPTTAPSATPKVTSTPAASESASRTSSLPAKSQSLPVSGSVDLTLKTIGLGIILILSGVVLWPKLRKHKKAEPAE